MIIATSDHIATYLLPRALTELRRVAPEIVPRIRTGAAADSVDGITAGHIDLGLFFKVERDPRLERRTVGKARCQLVVAPGSRRDARVLVRFIGSREVDDPANKSFPTVAMLAKKRPETAITLSCTSLEAHKSLVQAGLGVSILPRFVMDRELAAGSLVVFEPAYVYVASLDMVVARGRTLSHAARVASHVLRRAMETHPSLEQS